MSEPRDMTWNFEKWTEDAMLRAGYAISSEDERPKLIAAEIKRAVENERAQAATPSDERLREALDACVKLLSDALHEGIDYYDHDGSLIGEWQQTIDEARAALAETETAK